MIVVSAGNKENGEVKKKGPKPGTAAIRLATAERRAQVAKLYVQGNHGIRALARRFGVSSTTIARDLDAIRKEWRESRVEDWDDARNELRSGLRYLLGEAMDAWHRSKADRQRTRVKTAGSGNGKKELTVETEKVVGDPRFLEEGRRTYEMLAKLDRLFLPERHEVSGPNGTPLSLVSIVAQVDGGESAEVIDAEYVDKLVGEQAGQLTVEESPGIPGSSPEPPAPEPEEATPDEAPDSPE
jgi:hypothetical protein